MSAIYVEIDGNLKPISECSWVQVAPCGCTCAVLSAGGERNMPTLADEEQMLDFYDTPKWQRKEEYDNGFRYYLIDRQQACNRFKDRCQHIPRWGVEPRPQISGMEWGTKGGSRRFHLVPSDAVIHPGVKLADIPKDAPALCGTTAYMWHDGKFDEFPDCKKCTTAAREQTAPLDLVAVQP
jgi:hypothetical protein